MKPKVTIKSNKTGYRVIVTHAETPEGEIWTFSKNFTTLQEAEKFAGQCRDEA